MKYIFFLSFSFLLCKISYSQKSIEQYYNYNYEATISKFDASFITRVKRTDTGWLKASYYLTSETEKLETVGLFLDKDLKISNGYFYWLYQNGIIKTRGKYLNGKKEGLWLQFYSDGGLKDSTFYINDKVNGTSISWYLSGNTHDSITYDNNGSGNYYEWFSNSFPSCGGKYVNHKKEGKWIYYHLNSQISAVETYKDDSLINCKNFNDNGELSTDTIQINFKAEFNGGKKEWNKYVTNYLHSPSNVQIVNSDRIAVVVEFIVNEDGSLDNIEIVCPFHVDFDNKVLSFIKASPKWVPSKNHNRKFQQSVRLPIVFSQSFN